jgi:soluble cytochrome b562
MGNLIVADKEYAEMKKLYGTIGSNTEKYINDYIKIMNSIISGKLIEGEVANKMAAYINRVSVLKGQVQDIMKDLQKNIDSFVSEIDKADKYLY